MVNVLNRFADRMLARLLPRGEASACSPFWSVCYCANHRYYVKYCQGGCNGVPVYCGACIYDGYC